MRVLILGYSGIVRRRVLAALCADPHVSRVGVASRRGREVTDGASESVEWHVGYAEALRAGSWDLVYVSLPNALHAHWARAALEAGCHVVLDKPAFLNRAEAEACLALAARGNFLLGESVVWDAHPVWAEVERLRARFQCRWTHIAATFCFPPFPEDNFRNDPTLGGGALSDLGPYAVSCARRFFAAPAEELQARILSRHPRSGVDTAFAILARSGGVSLTGQFGFTSAYVNRLELIGDRASFVVEPAFTSQLDHVHVLRYRGPEGEGEVRVAAADSFARYLDRVFTALARGETEPETARLRQDAEAMAQLRTAAGCLA